MCPCHLVIHRTPVLYKSNQSIPLMKKEKIMIFLCTQEKIKIMHVFLTFEFNLEFFLNL